MNSMLLLVLMTIIVARFAFADDYSVPETDCCLDADASCYACQLGITVEAWCTAALAQPNAQRLQGCNAFTKAPVSAPTNPTKTPTFIPTPFPTNWPIADDGGTFAPTLPVPTVSPTPRASDTGCCIGVEAKCWACLLGVTVEEYCYAAYRTNGQRLVGCEEFITKRPTTKPTYIPTPFPTNWPIDASSSDAGKNGDPGDVDGSSGGSSAGIVILVLLILSVGGGFIWYRRKKQKEKRLFEQEMNSDSAFRSDDSRLPEMTELNYL